MSQLICIPSAFFYSGPQRIGCHFFECLFSGLWIQTLISSGNTLTGTPRKTFYQLSGHHWPSQIDA